MLTRDLKTFAELGRALWADPMRSVSMAMETLSAVSLLDLTEDRAMERAAAALLDRAVRQGMASNTLESLEAGTFGQPFFRLFPEERFVLAALHLGRWSYARVARVMDESVEAVEALAWKARVRLAATQGIHPFGTKLASHSCPEYDMDRPWTQRFLDEEIKGGRDLLFLQNHMMACDSCRASLSRCRDLYFSVEKMLPRLENQEGVIGALERVCSQGKGFRIKTEITFGRSVLAFLAQRDVQWILAFAFFCLLVAMMRK